MKKLELKGRGDKLKQSGTRGMAQWVKVPAAEQGNMRSILGIYTMVGEK